MNALVTKMNAARRVSLLAVVLSLLVLLAAPTQATRVDLVNGTVVVDVTHAIDPIGPQPVEIHAETASVVVPLDLNHAVYCSAAGCSASTSGTAVGEPIFAGGYCFVAEPVRCFISVYDGGHVDQQLLTSDDRVATGCVAVFVPTMVYRCHVVTFTEEDGTTCLTFGRWGDDHPSVEWIPLACVTP